MIPKESEVLSTGPIQKTSSSFNPDELNYFICGICGKKANGTLHNHFQHAKACIQMKRHSVICLYCPQDVLPSLPGMYLRPGGSSQNQGGQCIENSESGGQCIVIGRVSI